MVKQSINSLLHSLRHTLRDFVVDSIVAAIDNNNGENVDDCEKRFREFSEDLVDVIENTFDEDFENYSKESLKINMLMMGYDDDETFRYVNLIKDECVRRGIGIIDIRKPVELGNLAIALLEI